MRNSWSLALLFYFFVWALVQQDLFHLQYNPRGDLPKLKNVGNGKKVMEQTVGTESGINQSNKIPVALLITELAPGGAEKAFVHLALGLDKTRFQPTVYLLSGRRQDQKNSLTPVLRSQGVETVELGMKSVFDLPRVLAKLYGELKRRKPLLIQSFMFHANLIGRLAAKFAGVPLVCSGIRVAERDSKIRLLVDYATRQFCDAWICVGESVAEFTRTVGRIQSNRVFSIPNGVQVCELAGKARVVTAGFGAVKLNEDRSNLTPPAPFGRRKRLIAVGRLAQQKGLDWLLANMRNWLDSEDAKEWELWVVGDGEERENLTRICRSLGLEGDVYFAGWRSDAAELIAESEIFLLPSRWEGMPNALLEAAALGKPVLCADVEGVAEILGNSANEQICPWGDVQQWSEKARKLMSDDMLRQDLGQKNQERVLAEFTVERTTQKYERLWLQLLAEKNVLP